jgi:hypothetical protein
VLPSRSLGNPLTTRHADLLRFLHAPTLIHAVGAVACMVMAIGSIRSSSRGSGACMANFNRTVTACGFLLLCSGPAAAQNVWGGIVVGAADYDLSGTGVVPIAGVSVERYIHRRWRIQTYVAYLQHETTAADTRTHYVLPEAQLHVQIVPTRVIRPYIGIGGGAAIQRSGRWHIHPTLSFSSGMRILVTPRWTLGGELRIRSVRPWTGSTADWSIGIHHHL